jgi:vitamin B12 transporter
MIDSPPPDFRPTNVASAQVQGLELTASGLVGDWRVAASATFQSPTNRQTGETLLRRAKRFGAIDVSRRLGPWDAGADLAWGGSRHDFRIDNFAPVELESRVRLGLRLQRRILRDTSLVLRLDNVTDDDTPTAHGYIPTGRSLFVMLRWQPS